MIDPGRQDDVNDIDEIVSRYLDRINSGETLNPLEILADYPGLGAEPKTSRSNLPALSVRKRARLTIGRVSRVAMTANKRNSFLRNVFWNWFFWLD